METKKIPIDKNHSKNRLIFKWPSKKGGEGVMA